METLRGLPRGEVYLGRYETIRLLGEGGMGRVYFGRQLDNDRPVVIKVMHEAIATDPRIRQRFEREMLLMKRFRHPHAVALYDASLDDLRKPCIVMEYVPGVTLDDLVQKHGPLPPERVGRLLGQLCSVLQAAHSAGILHRDISAANLMVVEPDTAAEKLVVMDFGLARMGGGPYIALEKLTGSGNSIGGGTPDYMCPEQVRGDEVDHRGDLYSVGVVLFKLLTGQLPFGNVSDTADILLCHAEQTPPSFADVGTDRSVKPAVEAVVRCCLAKYPHERPQTARELADRFGAALGQKIMEWEDTNPDVPSPDPVPPSRPEVDPNAVVDQFEAWMPERIAVVKLRGFVNDVGGEVVESLPGLIRVRLPIPGAAVAAAPKGFWSFLGLGQQPAAPCFLLAELHMDKKQADHYLLQLGAILRPECTSQPVKDDLWRPFAERVCRELRAYLICRR
jgi:serine/threonine-protein kinase